MQDVIDLLTLSVRKAMNYYYDLVVHAGRHHSAECWKASLRYWIKLQVCSR